MNETMHTHLRDLSKGFTAYRTGKRLVSCMDELMVTDILSTGEALRAESARVVANE